MIYLKTFDTEFNNPWKQDKGFSIMGTAIYNDECKEYPILGVHLYFDDKTNKITILFDKKDVVLGCTVACIICDDFWGLPEFITKLNGEEIKMQENYNNQTLNFQLLFPIASKTENNTLEFTVEYTNEENYYVKNCIIFYPLDGDHHKKYYLIKEMERRKNNK